MDNRVEIFTAFVSKIWHSIKKITILEVDGQTFRGAQVFAIYYLYEYGDMTLTEISERCSEDKATISRAIDSLEEGGLVVRADQENKRYNCPIALTESGKNVGREIYHKLAIILTLASEGVRKHDAAALYRALSRISENLEKIAENGTDL
jgi:DNA-binding MarR family transcriptional regulator